MRIVFPFVAVLAVGVPLASAADDAADADVAVPVPRYDSAFARYVADREPPSIPWRALNDEIGRIGGHRGHVGHADATPASEHSPAEHEH
jgi:hypothetical protein